MASEDLEYYIKLPPPDCKGFLQCTGNDGDDFEIINGETNLPVVVLLGWAGCQDRHLSKYSAVYEERGCITLRTTAPMPALFWRRWQMQKIAKRVVSLLLDLSLQRHPVFFHAFSNGGAFLYQHVSEELQRSKSKINVLGLILDSAPGERRMHSLFLALQAIIASSTGCSEVANGAGTIWTRMPTAVLAAILSVALTAYWVMEAAFGVSPMDRLQPLRDEEPRWPLLLLYSDVDRLVLAKDVESFAESRRSRGGELHLVRFEGSPHVKHLLVHREKYINSVVSFMRNQLTSDDLTNDDISVDVAKNHGQTPRAPQRSTS